MNVTEHDPLARVHVGELNVPDAVPLAVKLTVPVGVLVGAGEVSLTVAVPEAVKLTVPVGVVGVPDVSATVAVQVVAWLITTGDGLHAIVVLVV